MKKLILIVFISAIASVSYSQSADEILKQGKTLLNQGKVLFDDSYFLEARGLFERISNSDVHHQLVQYYQALTDYNLAVYYLQKRETEKFKEFIKSAQEILKSLLKENDKDVESLALLGTVYGIQVSLDPTLGPTYGAQSVTLVSQALGLAPDNPRVLMLNGISKFNTPDFYGGSRTEALKYFSTSIEKFEEKSANAEEINWGYMEACAWQGRAYESLGEFESALNSYQKALDAEPDYSWVKYVLLPELEDKMN
ncbi:MAG: tetratricopeptide repeat protein [Ignavibacteria bacterium]|jgi:tetratricopeptide (TPR) repeat protein